jgi:hypothetical protein
VKPVIGKSRHGIAFASNIKENFSFYMLNRQIILKLRINLTIFLILGAVQLLVAQFGVGVQYIATKIESGSQVVNANGYGAGINYWLRLKNVRIEFFPELSYNRLTSLPAETLPSANLDRWALSVPVSFYPLDFKGDCRCPTFSKQNDLVKKGLFLQLVPTVQHERTEQSSDWHQNFGLGLGTGLDIGISDLITLTPLLQYIPTLGSTRDTGKSGSTNEIRAGIRVLFRPDYR